MMYQCNLKTGIPVAYSLHFNIVSVSVIVLLYCFDAWNLSDTLLFKRIKRIENAFIGKTSVS